MCSVSAVRVFHPYTGYGSQTAPGIMEPQLNERESSLVQAFRRLPPNAASELTALAERLAALSPDTKIDWADSWSDEDLEDFTAASVRRLEVEESEEPH